MCKHFDCPCEAEASTALTVERLARALHQVHGPGSNCNDPETATAILAALGADRG